MLNSAEQVLRSQNDPDIVHHGQNGAKSYDPVWPESPANVGQNEAHGHEDCQDGSST